MKNQLRAFIFLIISALPSQAADESMKLTYDVNWSGIRVGVMNLELKEDLGRYHYIANLDSLNIAKRVSKYWSTNIAQGNFMGLEYLPVKYVSRWNFKKEFREFNIHYEDGKITGETIMPVDNRGKFPPVPVEVKKNALDPVAAGVFARKKVKEIAASGIYPQNFRVEVFDGRRKFDLFFDVLGPQKLNYQGKQQNVLHVTLQRQPVMGFSKNELKDFKDINPIIDIYLDPETHIPVWAIGKAVLGSATFSLTSACVGSKATC